MLKTVQVTQTAAQEAAVEALKALVEESETQKAPGSTRQLARAPPPARPGRLACLAFGRASNASASRPTSGNGRGGNTKGRAGSAAAAPRYS